jgi:CubicO group peptidase (beta-lactamase class C family)
LSNAFENQDERFAEAWRVIIHAISTHAFPAASVAVVHQGALVALKPFGRLTFETDPETPLKAHNLPGEPSVVTSATLFDLASLTKVIATTSMAAILYQRGLLDLDAPILSNVPEFLVDSCGEVDPRRTQVTFRMLLAHSSGLPAYERLFLRADSAEDLRRAAFTTPLRRDPGTIAEYSDIGFIILGSALERLAGESLDRFCQREVFGPVAMTSTTFTPPSELQAKIPPTADEREEAAPNVSASLKARSTFRKKIVQGEVQDENASVLGGVAGHAGLFATAHDLARFSYAMLNFGHPILRPEIVSLFTRRESSPAGTSRALGWDTPSSPSQSGKHFGPASYGHLGYTGTSLWIDPDRKLSITLLTNRTWPDCSNQSIKQVRPNFHDAVVEALD